MASNGTTGVIGNRAKFEVFGVAQFSLCRFIPLGYSCCFIANVVDTTPSSSTYLISAASPVTPLTKVFSAGFLIDSDGLF